MSMNLSHKSPIFEGWLYKKGHFFRTWKLRWFELEQYRLSYYVDEKKTKLKGTYVLDAKSFIKSIPDQRSRSNLFELYAVGSGGKSLIMCAKSPGAVELWVATINTTIQKISMRNITNAALSEISEYNNDDEKLSNENSQRVSIITKPVQERFSTPDLDIAFNKDNLSAEILMPEVVVTVSNADVPEKNIHGLEPTTEKNEHIYFSEEGHLTCGSGQNNNDGES